MQFTTFLLSLLSLLSLAVAKSHDVQVGKGGLKFTPDTLTAEPGDEVHFHFYPSHHAVAESRYDKPCRPVKNSLFSGYFDPLLSVDKNMFTITVKDKEPMWLYCPTETHCQVGMAMVINPPDDGRSLASFKKRSLLVLKPTAPKKVRGGVMSPNKGS